MSYPIHTVLVALMDVPSNIPWQTRHEWDQVLLSIKTIERLGKERLSGLFSFADEIKTHFEIISHPMEDLCSCTCVNCEDICCLRATIWYDFKDLLYLYFATGNFPDAQIKKISLENHITACSCFSSTGCILPRTERPFVCTWYLCSAQKNYLLQYSPDRIADFDRALLKLKKLRNEIEEKFVSLSKHP